MMWAPVSAPHPLEGVIDLPGSTAAAVVNVTRDGTEPVATTMEHIADAIEGDPAAVDRAIESSKDVRSTLSRENYGESMLEAMKDRMIDRIPLARTVVNWFG